MMHHDSDAELVRAAIAELRAGDASEAGAGDSFDAALRRVPARRNRRATARSVLLAASVAAIAVLGYRVAGVRPVPLELPREVAALSAWRPLTDPLLDTPGRELLRGGTPLGASILDVNLNGVLR